MLKKLCTFFILTSIAHATHAQELYPGNLLDKTSKHNTEIKYSVDESNSGNIFQSTYKVFDTQKHLLYTLTLMNDKNVNKLTAILSSPQISITSKSYNPAQSGLFYSNQNDLDTSIDGAASIDPSYNYIFSFSDTTRLSPYAHKITTDDGKVISLDEISSKRVARHKKYIYGILAAGTTQSIPVAVKPQPEKPKLCQRCIDTLMVKMDADADNRIDEIKANLNARKTTVAKPDSDLNAQFNQLLKLITQNQLDTFNCTHTSVNDWITILVNPDGSVRSTNDITDSIVLSDADGVYKKLFNNSIKKWLLNTNYPVSSGQFSNPRLYGDFYFQYYASCKKLDSSMAVFSDFFRMKQTRMDSFAYVSYTAPTQYRFNLKYMTYTAYRKWKLKKNKNITDLSDSAKARIKDEGLISDFFASRGKKKLGRYEVRECFVYRPDGSLETHVDSVKRKYTYWTLVGATTGIQIPIGQSPKYSFGELVTLEGMVVYHHIGFFGGSAIPTSAPRPTIYVNGLQTTPNYYGYVEGGLYVGTCNYLYIKLGYSQVFGDHPGFLGGLSLLFPYVHIEGGYNYATASMYVNAGLNIPINR